MRRQAAAAAALITVSFGAGCAAGVLHPLNGGIVDSPRHAQSSTDTPYSQAVLADRPVAYYQLAETAGALATDDSSTAHSATYTSGVQLGVAGPFAQSAAVRMDAGAFDVGVHVPAPPLSANGSYTIETWVRPEFSGTYMTIWGSSASRRLLVDATGHLLTQFSGNFFSRGALSNNAWHDVTFVYDAAQASASYYIDGALDSSTALSASAASFTAAYLLGEYDTGANYKWHGSIAQHAVYASALTASQIAAHYHAAGYPNSPATPAPTSAPTPVPESPCVGYRWSIKVLTDPREAEVNLAQAAATTIASLTAVPKPDTDNELARMTPGETTVFRLTNVTLLKVFKSTDSDYHLLLDDGAGHTMIAEAPDPACASGSPIHTTLASVRNAIDAQFAGISSTTQTVNEPVTLQGVGFFDYDPNYAEDESADGAELHPILAICFGTNCSLGTPPPTPTPTPTPQPTAIPVEPLFASAQSAPAMLFGPTSEESGAIARLMIAAPKSNSTQTLTLAGRASAAFGWVGPAGYPASTLWPARSYDVTLNVVTPNDRLKITEIRIYRVNGNGGPPGTGLAVVADLKGLSDALAPARVLRYTLTGAAQTAASTDRFAVKFFVSNRDPHGESFGYRTGPNGNSALR